MPNEWPQITAGPYANELLQRVLPMLETLGDYIGNGIVDPNRADSLGVRCDLILDIKNYLRNNSVAFNRRFLYELYSREPELLPKGTKLIEYNYQDEHGYIFPTWELVNIEDDEPRSGVVRVVGHNE